MITTTCLLQHPLKFGLNIQRPAVHDKLHLVRDSFLGVVQAKQELYRTLGCPEYFGILQQFVTTVVVSTSLQYIGWLNHTVLYTADIRVLASASDSFLH